MGKGFDLNKKACLNNQKLNNKYVESKLYSVFNADFFNYKGKSKIDIIFSCMVIEHMNEKMVSDYFEKAKELLSEKGRIICLVPSSMKHWGIEDDIAGHIKRYELSDIKSIAKKHNLKQEQVTGLTYPISNLLLSLSNKIIKKNESEMLSKTQEEKTIYTGNREVQYKTQFPKIFNLILNSFVMYPFHLLQMMFRKNKNALVMYFELSKAN